MRAAASRRFTVCDYGWIGFDPTNNPLAGDRHSRVAIGRDYAAVPPTRGVLMALSKVTNAVAVGPRRSRAFAVSFERSSN